jgi:DNA-binding GntR family transcriptional regulator
MARPTRVLPPTTEAAPPATTPSEPLADVAYARIKAAILDGSLPPGLLASEQQIAARLAMSRTPVHEAIVRLVQEGWIEMLPRRGVMIAGISAADMHDVYEALMALEVAAVGRLAARAASGDDAVLQSLEQVCEDAETALAADDLIAWAAADDRFHVLLAELSGNRHIHRLARLLMEQVQRARALTLKLRPRPSASNADHRAVLAAIRKGDQAMACERMRAHRQRGMDVLLPILEALATRPNFLDGN